MLLDAALSALLNLLLLVVVPFVCYYAWHRWRHKRGLAEVTRRAGLQASEARYVWYSLAFAFAGVALLLLWSPPADIFLRAGSPQQAFRGLGVSGLSVTLASLYGVVKTGFAEEFLFRGLLAGSLARRFPLVWANLAQAFIFLLPHLLVLLVMPELWLLLPIVFVAALFLGWLRIKSNSIIGPWLIHAAANVTTCLLVAAKTAA
jgi:membrane protease YdiL (CAAX protease family)